MKYLSRRSGSSVAQRRKSFLAQTTATNHRRMSAERLEDRSMMAGDLATSYYNDLNPVDVNNDGHVVPLDALMVINSLNSQGSRSIAGGEGEAAASGSAAAYYDVNNDGYITPLDALLVINNVNAGEGEAGELVRYLIEPVAVGTNNVITTIQKGQDFELRMSVQDARGVGGNATGVFAAYLDVLTQTSKVNVYVYETQHISILGSPNAGGSNNFTLTYAGQTTAPIAFASNPITTANNIKTALANLSNIDAADIDVAYDRITAADGQQGQPYRWAIRFKGALGNQDVPLITGNVSGISGTNVSLDVTETAKGSQSDPNSVRYAFISPVVYDSDPSTFSDYKNGASGSLAADRFNDVGVFGGLAPPADPFSPAEFARVRLTALDGGVLTFIGTVGTSAVPQTDSPGHDTLLYGSQTPVARDSIGIYRNLDTDDKSPATLTVIEPVHAEDDSSTVAEDAPAGVLINVLTNDTKTTGGTLSVLSVDTAGTQGTAVVQPNGSIRFTPAANFNGTTTFKYTITNGLNPAGTDTGTVTVTVTPVNDAPVITLPAAPSTNEDIALTFTGATAIGVADADAGGGTVSATLTVTHGTIALTSANAGNNTTSITVTGTAGVGGTLNAALNGLVFTPDQNYNGLATLSVTANDGGNTGGAAATTTQSVNITINAVNDAPTVSVPGSQMVVEPDSLTFSGGNAITVADVDADAAGGVTVTLSVANGKLTLTGANAGNNTNSITVSGTVAAVNAAINNLVYTPNANFFDVDTLTVQVSDLGNTGSGGAKTATGTVQIDVQPGVRPRARRDITTVAEDTVGGILVDVLANDFVTNDDTPSTADDATPILIGIVTGPTAAQGTAVVENGKIRFTPAPDFAGLVTFTYKMNDSLNIGDSSKDSIGTVEINVTNVPDAPVAVADNYATNEDTTLTVPAASGLISNDTDPDIGATRTAVPATLTSAMGAAVTINVDGSFTYNPTAASAIQALAAGATANDTFNYTVKDGSGLTAVGAVTIALTGRNDAPVAVANAYNTDENTPLSIVAPGVLTGDSDVDTGDSLSVVAFSGASAKGAVVVLNADGSFSYDPSAAAQLQALRAGQSTTDTFTYTVKDVAGLTSIATVTITVGGINDAPTAVADPYSTTEDVILTRTATNGVLANDTDPDSGDTKTVTTTGSFTSTLGAAVVLNADGSFSYNPSGSTTLQSLPAGQIASDTFTYTMKDSANAMSTATVTVTVTGVNDTPVAVADSYATNEDTSITSTAANGLLFNDTDVDSGDTRTAVAGTVSSSKGATVTINSDGTFTYNPTNAAQLQALLVGQTAFDTFTYTVKDASGATAAGTATVIVTGINDNPVAMNDQLQAITNQPKVINVLINDNGGPESGETLTISSVASQSGVGGIPNKSFQGGTVTISADGKSVTYLSATGFEGTDTFVYTISDGNGGTATATVTLNVVNFIPTDIAGRVFRDYGSDNGYTAGTDVGIAGVEVTITAEGGFDALGGAFASQTVRTNSIGEYRFAQLRPGTYTITEIQPAHVRDGAEIPGGSYATVVNTDSNANIDQIMVTLPQLGIAGGQAGGNDFAELNVDTTTLTSYSPLQDHLASTNANGVSLAVGANGNTTWYYAQQGWAGLTSLNFQLLSAGSGRLMATVNGVTRTVLVGISGAGPRFYTIGSSSADGTTMIRLSGTAADFFSLPSEGEGEGEGSTFANAADHMFAQGSW